MYKDKINDLKDKIYFWEKKAKMTRDSVTAAILADKIVEAKRQIRELESEKIEQKVSTQIDAPFIADRKPETAPTRGQVIADFGQVHVKL